MAVLNGSDVFNVDNDVYISKDAKAIDDIFNLQVSEGWSEAVNSVLLFGQVKPSTLT